MSRQVVSVSTDTKLPAIVALLDKHRIKRVPVVDDAGKVVGVVSRADVLDAFAKTVLSAKSPAPMNDAECSAEIRKRLRSEGWSDSVLLGISVDRGVVRVSGIVASRGQFDAVKSLCEEVPGVRHVNLDGLGVAANAIALKHALRIPIA